MRHPALLVAVMVLAAALSCTTSRKSATGFHLPDGDPERGKAIFVEMKCSNCHSVAGAENTPANPATPVVLGGKVPYLRTDGELVTSIIDPSYQLAVGYNREAIQVGGKSRMSDTTHAMTVRQLIDLVAFLQAHYELQAPVQYR